MSEREIDFELIAAFIDGRLSGEERQRAVELLARSEAALEVYSDVLRVRADLGDDKVVPITEARGMRRPRRWLTLAPIAAAAVLLVAILPTMRNRGDQEYLGVPATQIVRPLIQRTGAARSLAGAWHERDWSVTRGGGAPLVDSTVVFRLGVRSVDLQVALAMGDTSSADHLAVEMVESLASVPYSDPARAEYAAFRTALAHHEPRERLVALASRAETAAGEFLQSPWFGFGKWVAAGELAARTRAGEFFADDRTAHFLDAVVERGDLAPADAESLREVGGLSGRGVEGEEFEAIRQIFRTLIRRHGG